MAGYINGIVARQVAEHFGYTVKSAFYLSATNRDQPGLNGARLYKNGLCVGMYNSWTALVNDISSHHEAVHA